MFPTNEVQQKGAKAICNTFCRHSSCQKQVAWVLSSTKQAKGKYREISNGNHTDKWTT